MILYIVKGEQESRVGLFSLAIWSRQDLCQDFFPLIVQLQFHSQHCKAFLQRHMVTADFDLTAIHLQKFLYLSGEKWRCIGLIYIGFM